MQIIKEYQENVIDMRGPGNWNAKPMANGTTCILRIEGVTSMSMNSMAALFNEAAKDFPKASPTKAILKQDRLEIAAKPTAAYKKLAPNIDGARG